MADAGSPGREGATALAKQSSVIAGAAGIGSDRAGRFVEGPIAGEASREKVDRSGRALGRASDAGGGNGDGLRGTNEGGGGIGLDDKAKVKVIDTTVKEADDED